MNKDRILAIEDDEGVCRLLRHSLAREDYQVRIAHNGEDGLAEGLENPPDLFLLDLDLPGMDGLAVCQELKKNPVTRALPVIILTGKGEESDVVQGLEMGADDYIVKPFSPKILNARLQAVLRRRTQVETTASAAAEIFEFGPLTVDTSSNSIKVDSKEIDLSPPEYHFALQLICFLSGGKRSSGCPQMATDENPVSIIGQEGMVLYSENRLNRLMPVFEGILKTDGHNNSVFKVFYGLTLFESNPEMGLKHLSEAARQFHADNDPRAELVVLSFQLFYHVIFDGDIGSAIRCLERAEDLNKVVFDQLTVFSRIAVAQNLAVGRSFLLNDFSVANEYLEIAEVLAEDRGLVNLVVLNRLVVIAESLVRGDQDAMAGVLEDCLRFGNHPQVSRLHKALLKILQLKYFCLVGNFDYLQLQEKTMREQLRRLLDQDSMASVQLDICQIESLCFYGQYDEALQIVAEVLQRPKVSANDLVRPLLLGLKAFCAAFGGHKDDLDSAIDACRKEKHQQTLRVALAKLYCARALYAVGRVSEAEETLALITPIAEERGWHNLSLQIRAQRLLLKESIATDAFAALISDMTDRDVWYLQTLTANDYMRIFTAAVETGAGELFVREMLRKRLLVEVDADGDQYPLLQIATLGGLKILLGRDLVALTDEFSRTQRECLALLAAAPDHRISQEEVQLAFWPDSSPEKARSTLDTMLSRFRRILKEKLQPYPVKKYLKLQKGVLCLEGVVVDAAEVVNSISRARELTRRGEFWQADIAYTMAFSRWHGQFMPGSCGAEQSAVYARQLQQLCVEAALEWSHLLNESGQVKRSIEVLTQVWSMDRSNESIMKALYRSHMRDGNISMAHQLLQQFEDIFRAEDYSPSEVARVVASFKSSAE